jgi:hypothetical protein
VVWKQDCTVDRRGWKRGRLRRYQPQTARRVVAIKQALLQGTHYFYGAKEVRRRYQQRYPRQEYPSLDFVKRVCRQHGLTQPIRKRERGCSHYQHYPAYTLAHLAESVSELDFIGEKNIRGQTAPIHVIAYNALQPYRFRQYTVIAAPTSQAAIGFLRVLWRRIPAPEVLKVDNDLAFIGSASGKRSLSRFVLFVLQHGVCPLFINPRSPWNNGSIEGSNSVFGRKFWQRHRFTSVGEVKQKLHAFNRACNTYLGYPKGVPRWRVRPPAAHIYFIRKVTEDARKGQINILNEVIAVPKTYINQYVFCTWNLRQQRLTIQYEHQEKLQLVRKLKFKINSRLGGSRLFAP